EARRIAGAWTIGDGKHPATARVEAAGVPSEALRVAAAPGGRQVVDFALVTSPDAPVGFDVVVDPPGAPVSWQLFLDDVPWPTGRTFAGPFGLPAVAARAGIADDDARAELASATLPSIDPRRDLGVFLTRERFGDVRGPAGGDEDPAGGGEAAREMQRMLQQWGYAHGPARGS